MPIEKNHSVHRSLAFNPSFQREKEMRSDVNLRLTLQKSSSIADLAELSSPLRTEKRLKILSDMNNKKTIRQSFSFSDLISLMPSGRITPQPIPCSAQTEVPPHTTVKTQFQIAHHSARDNDNSSTLRSYTKDPSNIKAKNGFALHLDVAEPVTYNIESYETLAGGVDEQRRSHNECDHSCNDSTRENFTLSSRMAKKQPSGRVLKKVLPVQNHLLSPHNTEQLSAARKKKRMLEEQFYISKTLTKAGPPPLECKSIKYTLPAPEPPTSPHDVPSAISARREIVPPRTTSFKTTVETCLEDFERYLLPTGNANPSIATLEGSTHHNGYAHKICDVKQPRLQTPSASNYGFLDLMDDTIMHALSYLTSADVRSVSVTCHDIRSLLTNPGAAQYLWMNICKRESWGSSLNIFLTHLAEKKIAVLNFATIYPFPWLV